MTGNVSYTAEDHEQIVKIRAEKVARLVNTIPEQTVFGPEQGDLLVELDSSGLKEKISNQEVAVQNADAAPRATFRAAAAGTTSKAVTSRIPTARMAVVTTSATTRAKNTCASRTA